MGPGEGGRREGAMLWVHTTNKMCSCVCVCVNTDCRHKETERERERETEKKGQFVLLANLPAQIDTNVITEALVRVSCTNFSDHVKEDLHIRWLFLQSSTLPPQLCQLGPLLKLPLIKITHNESFLSQEICRLKLETSPLYTMLLRTPLN